ncbi:hypothetical protein [Sphingobium algorifonticola]|jgi:hypothetical protein|uniref:Uncharacterized protein n=1 Tax=Sphingobium algorifonticola TaxID=2008318 RepID=A0A437J4X4_9SPHN|nr:hypothetical protein [Sphingobium algorifonticola]RVT39649.1 hypothetical protein ENE74_14935 [Sphingobium algorifonticola]
MDEIDWDNLPPTTAPTVPVTVKGFTNQEAGAELGKVVGECIMSLGSFIDLSTLEGVTIAIDYDAALAEADQGMEGLRPLDRTDTEEMQGVAKSCQVLRDGIVKTHLVFSAEMLVPLIAGDAVTEDDRKTSIGIIAHECGHVEVNARLEALVPDARLGARIADSERAVLFQIAEICWSEYAVCRLTARFAPMQNSQHAETVAAVAIGARERAREHIKSYRLHGDDYRVIGEAGSELCQPLKAAAYLLGGMDADGLCWAAFAAARDAVDTGGFGALIDELHVACRDLWDRAEDWTADEDMMAPLIAVARRAFRDGGIIFWQDAAGEWGISVPFTPDTMPDAG